MASYRGRASGLGAIGLVLLVVLGIWLGSGRDPGSGTGQPGDPSAAASSTSGRFDPVSGLPYVELDQLPAEAAGVVDEIGAGPPYAYDEDGAVFGNYEGLLPDQERGFYEEFTVTTPGSEDRGARRIIAGDDGTLYWTADHYVSFAVIRR